MFSSTIIIVISTLPFFHLRSSICSAARRPLDLDKHTRHNAQTSYYRDYSPDYNSVEPKRSRYPKQDPAAPHSRSKYPEHYLLAEGGHSRHADPYPEHLLPPRGKHGDRYPDCEPTGTGRARDPGWEDTDRVVRRKERPARPPAPQIVIERDKTWDKDRDRQHSRERPRDVELERHKVRDERRDRALSGDRVQERHQQRQKDNHGQHARTRSREREIDSGERLKVGWAPWETEDDGERERRAKGRQRVHSGPEEVFDEQKIYKGRGDAREFWDTRHEEGLGKQRSHSNGETGTTLSPPLGPAGMFVWCAGAAFSLSSGGGFI